MIDRDDSPDLFASTEPPNTPAAGTPAVAPLPVPQPASMPSATTLGSRLRAAREAGGLDIPTCAGELHLPIKVLQRLEADDYGEPQHFVFLRGALQSYARFLGLPAGSCDEALRRAAPAVQPALVSVARTSPARWLLQRYGTAATYIVLTATIAVPLVLLGLRGGLDRPSARIVSLDQAPVAAAPQQAVAKKPAANVAPSVLQDETPFRASMTPFAAIGLGDADSATRTPVAPAPVPAAVSGAHTLTVSATGDCWFEITDAEGNKVDSGMLHAGDSRSWHSADILHVTLGNADGVSVTSDGQPLALSQYRHANVARFDVFGAQSGSGENN